MVASPLTVTPNIVVFGQTGAGKSSLINLLARDNVAPTSSKPSGCTESNESFNISSSANKTYTFWDTPGLNEGEQGTVPASQAVDILRNLVDQIRSVNLIIYCIRGRLTDIVRVNYDLFCGIVCEGKVPILLVVTGLEQESKMDDWWSRNYRAVRMMGMKKLVGHACVVTTRGMNNVYEKEYSESADKVWKLVQEHCSTTPWTMKTEEEEVRKRIAKYMNAYNKRTTKIIRALLRLFR